MATVLTLSCGTGTVYDAGSGTLICAAGTNSVVSSVPDLPTIAPADIAVLLTLALGIFAAMWGFRVLGSLIFKTS
ncbi:MAG: hypothetical protein H7836_15720 [Magnetococcus sp. YQC-3]